MGLEKFSAKKLAFRLRHKYHPVDLLYLMHLCYWGANRMASKSIRGAFLLTIWAVASIGGSAIGAIVTDPNDARSWQGATAGTFAQLFYGADTLANRQLVVNNQLLDDGIFNSAGYTAASLYPTAWSSGFVSTGYSLDTTGTGSYGYITPGASAAAAAGGIDEHWIQSSGVVGETVFDLGAQSTKAAVFNTIDHGPLPQEAIESTVYLSNDLVTWTQAVVERVWLEGFQPNTGILWDGFVFAVGTGTNTTFRYASVIHGGPGALQSDGDDEINGLLGLNSDFQPNANVPEASSLIIWGFLLAVVGSVAVVRIPLRRISRCAAASI